MARLSTEHKVLIVSRLAAFVAPSEIVAELKELGVTASIEQVFHYDPTAKGSDVGQRWREMHTQLRAEFLRDTASIPIAHKSYRLRELNDMARQAKLRKNFPLAAQLLEQAAKEMGESYTNRRVLEPADPVAALAATLGVTPEEITGALADVAGA